MSGEPNSESMNVKLLGVKSQNKQANKKNKTTKNKICEVTANKAQNTHKKCRIIVEIHKKLTHYYKTTEKNRS